MRILSWCKDGGPESTVSAFWLLEIKRWFSIGLLKFGDGTRSAFHTHAFNSWSWVLWGCLIETLRSGQVTLYKPSWRFWRPIRTLRETFHRVRSWGTSWVFTIRGPWSLTWDEYDPNTEQYTVLTNGRQKVSCTSLA